MSKSTDKLQILAFLAERLVKEEPGIVDKIKKIEVKWTSICIGECDSVAVPNVFIEFKS